MFDEQEQKLLSQALNRARKDYRNNSNVYGVSAFDEKFDAELEKLVILYHFDFEAIALHLHFKFPQYAFRMKPQAVSYRWYQLTLEREGERIREEIGIKQGGDKIQKLEQQQMEEIDKDQRGGENGMKFDLNQKREHYEAALRMAHQLDEEQEQGFMIYRPKFIVDSEFKLQRQRSEDTMIFSALLDNQISFEFGSFSAPQAAPLNIHPPPLLLIPAAPPPPPPPEQDYIEDDWEAYQSD